MRARWLARALERDGHAVCVGWMARPSIESLATTSRAFGAKTDDSDGAKDEVDARLSSRAGEGDSGASTTEQQRPGRVRSDRLFYPGQAYEAEDLAGANAGTRGAAHTVAAKTVKHPMRGKAVEATLLERTSFEDARFLTQFVSDTGKIYPKRRLGVSAKAQRKISRAIKTARQMGILPYTSRLPQFQRSNNML
ncbi:Ribosomal protein S18 [Ostreococcus tauri]|uniref:Small ribosomal subunit protein bS18c n=2 Tax=Ostreococcus tauri TaxID=70448 RepID=A0A096PBN6_OSTTA|nr:Ribosomal protein S18 [Ostreococcus tauri]CEG02014.1 Ribosomal protein S18 [Ostreococcus tauri]|eukprot:XP_003082895.2 Ribosomal protein S18 [Ostreococcus tauri]